MSREHSPTALAESQTAKVTREENPIWVNDFEELGGFEDAGESDNEKIAYKQKEERIAINVAADIIKRAKDGEHEHVRTMIEDLGEHSRSVLVQIIETGVDMDINLAVLEHIKDWKMDRLILGLCLEKMEEKDWVIHRLSDFADLSGIGAVSELIKYDYGEAIIENINVFEGGSFVQGVLWDLTKAKPEIVAANLSRFDDYTLDPKLSELLVKEGYGETVEDNKKKFWTDKKYTVLEGINERK